MGFFVDSGPEGDTITESFTCCHCNRPTAIDRAAPVAMCHNCFRRVCNRCHAKGTCTPFEKKLERIERRAREDERRGAFLRAVGVK
jgi:hypothetical protein